MDFLEYLKTAPNGIKKTGLFYCLTGIDRRRLSDTRHNVVMAKNLAMSICLGIGLNLLLTLFFMRSAGHNLRQSFHVDTVFMEFIETHKGNGIDRIAACRSYMQQKGVKEKHLPYCKE